ncbi:hypothetical protein DE146DRAFT_38439 [Phaeosphaeria sp. MPI-PUGE-AT-0046c]|nr:hypothetical protein DE146DRAFT_38439 [Phaeosphaeria sp. MPI-PUGE-AT-0046c]
MANGYCKWIKPSLPENKASPAPLCRPTALFTRSLLAGADYCLIGGPSDVSCVTRQRKIQTRAADAFQTRDLRVVAQPITATQTRRVPLTRQASISMSSRQKSFFDQDPKAKHFRGQWLSRNAPPHFPRPNNNTAPPARHVVSGPPIMPSTQTRTKLKAFQFIEGAPNVETTKQRNAEKENLRTANPAPAVKHVGNTAVTPKPATSKSCPPPSTPAMKRPPLADLVGNIDDSSRHAPQPVVSPEEQLIWRGSQPMNTPLPRKNKKRARSSSPAAPSQEDPTLEAAKNYLTTPQADPVLDMWSRYTSKHGTPSANKSVAFAHLINESSPRSALAAGSVSGLRRWASCGHEFPASNRKRRRTHGVFQSENERTEDVFAAAPSSDGTLLGPGKSNVASMVQRMKACVKPQPRISSQLPSSSSPLPDTGERHLGSSGSPLQRRAQEMEVDISETAEVEEESLGQDAQMKEAEPSSDDFGDDDFDEVVGTLDITPQADDNPAQQDTSYATIPTEPMPNLPQQQPRSVEQFDGANSEDEFGMDEDEDGFAADLEQVASLYDTRTTVSPSQKATNIAAESTSHSVSRMSAATTPIIDLVEDDEDEFGDDIDVDVFAAAEVAATQTPGNTSQQDARAIQRYLIKRIDEGTYITDRGYTMNEKVATITPIYRAGRN